MKKNNCGECKNELKADVTISIELTQENLSVEVEELTPAKIIVNDQEDGHLSIFFSCSIGSVEVFTDLQTLKKIVDIAERQRAKRAAQAPINFSKQICTFRDELGTCQCATAESYGKRCRLLESE